MADSKDEKPSRNFLTKLYAKLKELVGDKISEEDFNSAVTNARAHAGGKAKAAKRNMAEQSLTDIVERVNTALTNYFRQPLTGYSIFYYAKEVYADRVIACSSIDSKLYEIPYTMSDDEVAFGDPVEVEETYTPVGMNELANICAKGHGSRLFIETKFAEAPDWIPFLPIPGEFKHPVYGEIVITKERNENFVSNFGAGIYQKTIPVDAEHETKLSGAVGWITEMRVNDDGSADAKVAWTDRGKLLIEEDRFKYVSPEWYDNWTEPASGEKHSDVAIGAALTTRPFFKEGSLRPLVANEAGLHLFDEEKSTSESLYFTALAPAQKEIQNMPDQTPEERKFAELTGKVTQLETELATTKTDLATAKTASETLSTTVTSLSEQNASLMKESRTRRFSDLITKGNWLGKPEDHLALMETLGEGSDAYNTYVTQQNAIGEQAKSANLFAEVGSDASGSAGAYAKMSALANEMVKAGTAKTFAQAIDDLSRQQPQLYQEYLKEQRSVN